MIYQVFAMNNAIRYQNSRMKLTSKNAYIDLFEFWLYAHSVTSFHLSSLKISEHTLKEVAEQQGSDLQSIAALVKENEEILDQMKACYYNVIDTFLFTLVIANLFSIDLVHSTGKLCSRINQADIEIGPPRQHED